MAQTNHSHSFFEEWWHWKEGFNGTNTEKTLNPLVFCLEFKAQAFLTCTLKGIDSVTPTPFNFKISRVSVLGCLWWLLFSTDVSYSIFPKSSTSCNFKYNKILCVFFLETAVMNWYACVAHCLIHWLSFGKKLETFLTL